MSRAALIVTGPKDGEFTDFPGRTMEFAVLPPLPRYEIGSEDPVEFLTVEKLVFKRIVFKIPYSFTYLAVFVPEEWAKESGPVLENRLLGHLLKKAFQGATGI